MKRLPLVLFLLTLGLFTACQKSGNESALKAEILGAKDGDMVYLSELKDGSKAVPIDSATVKDGKIDLKLPESDTQTLDFISIKGKSGNLLFINEDTLITGTLYADSLYKSKIEGGAANKMFAAYQKRLLKARDQMTTLTQGYSRKELMDPEVRNKLMTQQQGLQKELNDYRAQLIKENPDQLPSILLLADMMSSNMVPHRKLEEAYNSLSQELQKSNMGKNIKNHLEQSAIGAVGSKAPKFKAKTPEGKELALEDVMGKYTLIDFWAAWCGPCRKENPNVVKIYKKYHDKGLNILGVSLDGDKESWVKAIKHDGLLWNQVSNLKHWDDPIARQYNVRAIPANFLLDENGKIVARDLRGQALWDEMEKLLDKN